MQLPRAIARHARLCARADRQQGRGFEHAHHPGPGQSAVHGLVLRFKGRGAEPDARVARRIGAQGRTRRCGVAGRGRHQNDRRVADSEDVAGGMLRQKSSTASKAARRRSTSATWRAALPKVSPRIRRASSVNWHRRTDAPATKIRQIENKETIMIKSGVFLTAIVTLTLAGSPQSASADQFPACAATTTPVSPCPYKGRHGIFHRRHRLHACDVVRTVLG